MKEFLHVFQNDSEFNGSYNGNSYSEPWVSYTKTVEQKYNGFQATINGNGPYTYTFLFKDEDEGLYWYIFGANVVNMPITSINTNPNTIVVSGKTFYFNEELDTVDSKIFIWITDESLPFKAITNYQPSINDIAQIVSPVSASTTITAVGNDTITVNGNIYNFDFQQGSEYFWFYVFGDNGWDEDYIITTSRTPSVGTVTSSEYSEIYSTQNPSIGDTFYRNGNKAQVTAINTEAINSYRVNYNKKATDEPLTLEFLENGTFRIEKYIPLG